MVSEQRSSADGLMRDERNGRGVVCCVAGGVFLDAKLKWFPAPFVPGPCMHYPRALGFHVSTFPQLSVRAGVQGAFGMQRVAVVMVAAQAAAESVRLQI